MVEFLAESGHIRFVHYAFFIAVKRCSHALPTCRQINPHVTANSRLPARLVGIRLVTVDDGLPTMQTITVESCTAACVTATLCTRPCTSLPICAFMPKYQAFPFFVCFISGSRCRDRAPALTGCRILLHYRLQQLVPGQYRLHLGQKPFFARGFLLMLIGQVRKTRLFHGVSQPLPLILSAGYIVGPGSFFSP